MRILHIAPFFEGSTSNRRAKSFEKIGFKVNKYDVDLHYKYWARGLISFARRFPWSLVHRKINKEIYKTAFLYEPEIFFVEKAKFLYPETVRKLKKLFPKSIWLHFSPDDYQNPNNSNWHQRRNLKYFDRIITTKAHNVEWLKSCYGDRIDLVLSGGPEAMGNISNENYLYQISFIGQYESERAQSILKLSKYAKIDVFGPDWELLEGYSENIALHPPVWGEDYINTIRNSNINLCFLRKANRDLSTTRTFELASVGALMVAERTDEHEKLFIENKEVLFFSDDDELRQVVQRIISEPNRLEWDAMRQNLLNKYKSSAYSDLDIWRGYLKRFA